MYIEMLRGHDRYSHSSFIYCLVIIESFVCIVCFKQKTAYDMRISDWSSDVCSSDLTRAIRLRFRSATEPIRSATRLWTKMRPRSYLIRNPPNMDSGGVGQDMPLVQ